MNKRTLFCIGVIAQILLSLILYHYGSYEAHFDLDSYGYERIACHVARYHELKDPTMSTMPVQTMGYPFIMGMLYACGGCFIGLVIIAQMLCWIIVSWLIWKIARQLFNEQTASISFLLASINLGYLIFAQFILAEIILATFLLTAFECLYLFYTQQKKYYGAIAGLLYGFSMLIKPIIIGWLCLMAVYFLIFYRDAYSYKIKMIGLFFCMLSIPIMIYMKHNQKTFGYFAFAPVAHESLYIYFLSKLCMHEYGYTQKEAFEKCYALAEKKPGIDRWQESKRTLKKFLIEKPYLVISIWLQNVSKTLGGFYTSQLKRYCASSLPPSLPFFSLKSSYMHKLKIYLLEGLNDPFAKFLALFYGGYVVIQVIFMMVACAVLLYRRNIALLCVLLSLVLYTAGVTGHDGCARFRITFEWVYIILTAYGISTCYSFLVWYTTKWLGQKKEMYA